jgi:hypothetical protein
VVSGALGMNAGLAAGQNQGPDLHSLVQVVKDFRLMMNDGIKEKKNSTRSKSKKFKKDKR